LWVVVCCGVWVFLWGVCVVGCFFWPVLEIAGGSRYQASLWNWVWVLATRKLKVQRDSY